MLVRRMAHGQRELLGGFEQHVMAVALHLKEKAYGAEIWRELNARTQRDFENASVYASLDRLEARGFLEAKWGEATSVKGGRAKKFYVVTEPGMAALTESKRLHDAVWEGIEMGYPRTRTAMPRLDLKEKERRSVSGREKPERTKPHK